MPRAKFLQNTSHPDLGVIKADEVLLVSREYLRDYEALGIAEEADEAELTPRAAAETCPTCGQVLTQTAEA